MSWPSPPGGTTNAPIDRWEGRHSLALLLVVLLAFAHLVPFLGYLTDDTFIHFQFAKNLISGGGFSFEPGRATYGDTSPGWVLLMAATGRVVPGAGKAPPEAASMPSLGVIAKAWGALCLAASVLLLTRLGSSLGWAPSASLAAAALLAAHAWSARWALSGMETPLATLLVVAAVAAVASVLVSGKGTFVPGLLLGLATLARPECWLLLALGLAAIAYGSKAGRTRRITAAAGGALLGAGPWLVAAWAWFHQLLPNTSAAKAGVPFDPPLMLAALRASIRIFLSADALPLAALIVTAALWGPTLWHALPRERRAFWLFVAGWPLLLVVGLAAGGVQVVSRYLVPAAPSILLLGVASLRWTLARRGLARATAALALFLALDAGVNGYLTLRYSAPHARRHTAGLRSSLASFGLWARANTPPGTLFAMPDIGAFGYYSERPVLDLFGLVTPAMAPVVVRAGYDRVVEQMLFESVGRPSYLLDRAPDVNRLASPEEPSNPYQFIMARSIPDLGITRPRTYVYSLYAIRWDLYDRLKPRFALGGD